MKKTFERFGDEAPSAERITVNIGLPLEEAISDLAPDLSREQIEERASFYRKIYSEEGVENIRPMQGVAKLLERLSDAGVRMALVSNKRDDVLQACIEKLGWKRYFGFAGGVLEDGISKPDPAFRIEEMRKAFQDVEAAEILMVGDTKEDMIYARNLGVDACLALYGYGRSAQARIEAPDFEVRMPEEIESVVL
jgi:HAD superfamily hydrolase (TIGR01549 family)